MKLGEGACLEKSVVQFGWYAGQAERATFLVGFQCRSKDFSSAANGGPSYRSKSGNTRLDGKRGRVRQSVIEIRLRMLPYSSLHP